MKPLALLLPGAAAALAACSFAPAKSDEDYETRARREAARCATVVSEAGAQGLAPPGQAAPAINRLVLSGREGISWNGAAIDRVRLRQFLDMSNTLVPAPLLVVRIAPDTAPAHVENIREAVYLSLGCRADSF